MVELSAQVLNDIRKAKSEGEIATLIHNSIAVLQKRDNYSGRSKRKFTFNLMVVLKYTKLKGEVSVGELRNLGIAMEILGDIRKKDSEIYF